MRKKGTSHIEIILAFVLFVSVVIFMLYFFNPASSSKNLIPSAIQLAQDKIIENTNTEVEFYSVKISGGGAIVALDDISAGYKAAAFDLNGNQVKASVADLNKVKIEKDGFIYLVLSEDIEETLVANEPTGSYEIASTSTRKIISEKKLKELKEGYSQNYEQTKERLLIPSGLDFSFNAILNNEKIISAEREIPLKVEVFAQYKRIEMIKSNGEVASAYLEVKVW